MALPERALPLFGAGPGQAPQDRPETRLLAEGTAPPAPPGCGPLVRAAWPLLALLGRLVAGASGSPVPTLMAAAVTLVRGFEQAALTAGISPRDVAAARYSLCSALDEAVLTTAWGQASAWNANTLLSRFHGETWGGEKVFGIIDRVLEAPQRYPDLLDLLHRLMLLGFQGRFRAERDGTARADVVRERLFQAFRTQTDATPSMPSARPIQTRRARGPTSYVPVWIVAVACLVLALSTLGYLRYRLQDAASVEADRIAALTQRGGPGQSGP